MNVAWQKRCKQQFNEFRMGALHSWFQKIGWEGEGVRFEEASLVAFEPYFFLHIRPNALFEESLPFVFLLGETLIRQHEEIRWDFRFIQNKIGEGVLLRINMSDTQRLYVHPFLFLQDCAKTGQSYLTFYHQLDSLLQKRKKTRGTIEGSPEWLWLEVIPSEMEFQKIG
ncbi:hypothetical protein ACFYKX_11540 [Cytobacillus sp. FJAT-54145]|uniref:Uncharacterized protein n=1 Tax=Cytobacillus spartinae TaxID=3299023 RepID=A0ABW6KBX3_9BACI